MAWRRIVERADGIALVRTGDVRIELGVRPGQVHVSLLPRKGLTH